MRVRSRDRSLNTVYVLTMDREVSSDATLSGLALSDGTLRPIFDSETTEYRAAVANSVAQITVAPTVNDAGATVTYQDHSGAALADANTDAAGQQVDAAVGLTTFKVKVTAADGVAVRTYTVVIERDSNAEYGWTPTRDLNGLTAADNTQGQGLWTDGTTIWAADFGDDKFYAYTLANGARDSAREFPLDANNDIAAGVWSDGTTIWVADVTDVKLYAYTLSGGARDSAKDIALHSDNGKVRGVWSDGATIWTVDWADGKLYAYALSDGTRDITMEFALHTDNGSPEGIWSDGTTMWVADYEDNMLYAYAPSGGAHKNAKDFTTLTGAGGFGAIAGPAGLTSDGITMWVLEYEDISKKSKIYSFNMPRSDDATLKALALSGMTLNPAFSPGTLGYDATAGTASAMVTATPRQRFTRSVTITPADADGDDANGHQVDLPDDALTIIRVRVTAQDGASKTYTVRVTRGTPPVPADDATLIHLSLSNPADGGAITLRPPFGSGETNFTYAAQVDNGVSEADVSATARHPSATVAVTGGAGNVLAGPVPLDEGKNVINVTVTAADGSASRTYTVTVYRAEPPPQIIKGPYIRRTPANGQTFAGPYVIQGPDGSGGVIREEIEVLVTFERDFLVWPDSDRSASEIGTANAPFPYVELDIGGVKRRAHYWAQLPTAYQWQDNPENTAIFTYEVQPGDLDRNGVTIAAGEVFLPDPANTDRPDAERPVIMAGGRWGDPYDLRHEGMAESWPVNLAAPRVTGVAFANEGDRNGRYDEGSEVVMVVNFNETVVVDTVGGVPRIRMDLENSAGRWYIGSTWYGGGQRYAVYTSGSGTPSLRFVYRPVRDDWDSDGVDIPQNGLEPDGGRIHSEHHSAVLARLGHAGVAGGGARLVDGIPPSIRRVTLEPDPNGGFTDVHVDFDEMMTVGINGVDRKPYIGTNLGDAVYHSISDRVIGGKRASRLTFRYQGAGSVAIPAGAKITGDVKGILDLAGNEPRSLLVDGGG